MSLVSTPHSEPSPGSSLEVYLLGVVDFDAALALQEQAHRELASGVSQNGVLIVCEHPPLVTMGREASVAHLRCDRCDLASRRIGLRWLNRGGGALVHGPGQLACYPVLPVFARGMGLHAYRTALEQAAIGVCAESQVPAETRPGVEGIWTRQGRIASLGIAVRDGVSQHGLFFNAAPSLELLRLTKDEPTQREGVTSLAAVRLRPISLGSVRESLVRHLVARLGFDRHHIYTQHPSLHRTRRLVPCL